MYVYVIASSARGPSKVGVAGDPERRLRTVQTGSHTQLSLYHIEPIGNAAKAVERAAQRTLSAKKCGGGNEWFSVSTTEARIVVRSAATAAKALVDQDSTLRELELNATLQWLEEYEQLARECEELGEEEPDENSTRPPSVMQLLAGTVFAPASKHFNFNDYLLTFDDGMWIRWAFERMGRRMPSGKRLRSYLDADEYLEQRDAVLGRDFASRWIEWGAARDLLPMEARSLAEIWNKFVPLHNLIERKGPQWPTYGIDDCVDDVHLFALSGDRSRGDGWCVVFLHENFRAVIIPDRNIELHHIDWSMISEGRPLGDIPVSGFVAPLMPRDIWDRKFFPWLRNAPERRDKSLAAFLGNTKKRYPAPRPYDGPKPATQIWIDLPCIDEDGTF